MTFEEARAQFPVLERVAYLNAGTFGPLARRTAEAVAERVALDAERGRSGAPLFDESHALRESVRGAIAATLGVEAAHVALTSSTTDACNVVLGGLDLEPGDEIVTTDVEHFGLLGPLNVSGARIRVAEIQALPPERALEAILAQVGPRTRLIALSHVAWTTGNVLPLEELRSKTELPLLVDGAQSIGAIPVTAAPFDFYTVSGQKWLCGPDATGALYVREPESLRIARPSHYAQASYERPGGAFVPRAGALRFDTGWTPPSSLAGLQHALGSPPDWRFERAAATAARCRSLLAERFEVITAADQATLVTFRVDGDAAAVSRRLFERGVVVRDLPGTDWLRASCGYWTSDEDLARLVAALP
jgi:L-cysteine/cystine lyase